MSEALDHIIVGVDLGKTCAVACITLDGRLIHKAHKRFAGPEWVIKTVDEVGTPSVIATDKKRISENIRKINAAFNSKIFSPMSDITTEEKRELTKAIEMENQHEADAYSAAIKAYNSYANKLNQAAHRLRDAKIGGPDAIKAKIIRKYSMQEAILNKEQNRK